MKRTKEERILTIPNAMSLFRIVLIPVFIWLYHVKSLYGPAIFVLLLSCATDLMDGWVARHFDMVSNLGKMLDPVADKLTQGTLLICLIWDFPILLIPLILFLIKECIMAVTNLLVIRKSGEIHGAAWHGKTATFLIDLLIIIHVLWHGIPFWLSAVLSVICTVSMLVSLVLYMNQNRKWF